MRDIVGTRFGTMLGLGVASIFLAVTPGWLQGEALSLREAIEQSLERNEEIQAAREAVRQREGRVREVRSGAFPSLTADFSYTRNIKLPVIFFETEEGVQQITIGEENAYSLSFGLEQTIDLFGRVPKALDVAHLYAGIGEENLVQVESEVVYSVKRFYYGAVLAEELSAVAGKSLEQAEASLSQIESMVREGTKSRFDLLRARVEVANRKPELIRAQNQAELSKSRLRRIIGLPLDEEIRLTDKLLMEPLEIGLDEGIQLALSRRPELRSVRMDEEMGEVQLGLAGLERYPEFFFSSNYSFQGQTEEAFPEDREIARSWAAGVGFRFPLFDGMRTSGKVDQARAQLSMARYRKVQAEEEVRLEVLEAFRDLEAAEEEIRSQQANVEEAEEAYRLATIRFTSGLSTQLEVNDVELALNLARTNFYQSLFNYNTAKARVEKAIGEEVR